jgi:MYXO-CTERM domain-containing protein
MISTKRQLTLGILAGLAGFGVSTPAQAQSTSSTPQSTVVLNTALTVAYQAPNGEMPTKRRDGAGGMDTTISFDRTTGDIYSFFTRSIPWGNETGAPSPNVNTGMQAAMAYTKLTTTGLTTPQVKILPLQGYNGEQRVFMRPNTLLGKDFVAVVFADENNGVNDGNPQSVVWAYDRATLNQLNITNAGDVGQGPTDPVNLISLSGNNDGQQQCPHSYCQLPDEADGSESWIMGQQYNNQEARVMKVNFKTDGAGGVKVTVPYIRTIWQTARHNRVALACNPATGRVAGQYIVATTVDADEQPANYGVQAILVDVTTGKNVASTRVVSADRSNQLWAVQPTIHYVSDSVVALQYQMSNAPENRNDGGGKDNDHSGSPNLSYLTTLSVPSAGGTFNVIQSAPRVAPYNRHAEAFGLQYGPDGATSGGVGVIAGASTGLGPGLVQIMPIKADGTFDATPDPLKLYQVSKYSDIAGLPAMTKRDPDQARGFIHTYSGLPNPGYRMASGFMPEVKTFSISAVAGYLNPSTDNRESITFALVPASWDPNYATTPGSATTNVPPGPGKAPPTGTPVTNPSGPSAGGGTPGTTSGGTGAVGGGTGSTGGSTGGTGGYHTGFGNTTSSSGCGCTTAGSDQTSGATGFAALGLGFAFLSLRRRNSKKES